MRLEPILADLCKGIQPIVHLVAETYEKGIKVDAQELAAYRDRWHPSQTLPKCDVTILPG